jgi:5-oxopent-3-ene-1,2,5-tricarboxylate decarboxylase/2-hydroxyhepta-2,4-diene-1,7-dioate isomerase
MATLTWGPAEAARLAAIRDDLAQVSTATAFHMLHQLGWRNTYMQGLRPLQELGLGKRLVGRARTARYLMRRGPEAPPADEAARAAARATRRNSPEIVLIESLEPGDFFCVDALGVRTAGIIGDILAARIKSQGALAAVIHGVVRDTPFVKSVGLPVFCAGAHPSASGRDVVPVEFDAPVSMAGVHLLPGDILLADDEGVVAMPLDLAEHVAAHGPAKEHLELWIRDKIAAGGSIHDYYPPTPEKEAEYTRETGRTVRH